ncbi:MAG: Em GEA1 (EM1) [Deltaproteobacteria bacterium]
MSVVEAGRKGGERVLQERGPQFFSKIGKKGGQRVRELINAGRRAELT